PRACVIVRAYSPSPLATKPRTALCSASADDMTSRTVVATASSACACAAASDIDAIPRWVTTATAIISPIARHAPSAICVPIVSRRRMVLPRFGDRTADDGGDVVERLVDVQHQIAGGQ